MESAAVIRLFGLVEFSEPILCARDALGSSNRVEIGGVKGFIELPGLAPDAEGAAWLSQTPLVAPVQAATWKRGENLLRWGHPVAMPSGVSSVSLALLYFDVELADLQNEAAKISSAFNSWRSSFENHIEVYTKQRKHHSMMLIPDSAGLELLAWGASGEDIRPRAGSTGTMSVVFHDQEVALTLATLRIILGLVARGAAIELPYQLQLEAYRALRSSDYRKAIIETAVAAEMVLTKACLDALDALGVGSPHKILERFRTLGGRISLATILQVGSHVGNLNAALVKPRNAVVHLGQSANKATADAAISATDQLLSTLLPLPTS